MLPSETHKMLIVLVYLRKFLVWHRVPKYFYRKFDTVLQFYIDRCDCEVVNCTISDPASILPHCFLHSKNHRPESNFIKELKAAMKANMYDETPGNHNRFIENLKAAMIANMYGKEHQPLQRKYQFAYITSRTNFIQVNEART